MQVGNVWAVFQFELRRALTAPRLAWWLVLALFPVLIVTLIRFIPKTEPLPREPWSVFLFVLIPMLISMLGTFLWTAPAVSAELERQSWTYVAVRPGGRTALLLGKYLAAVVWVLPALLLGLSASIRIAAGELSATDAWRMGSAVGRIALLSCLAYAALYLLLGTLFPKRSMVVAMVYTLVFEFVVSMVPAVINKFTVQFRLRALLMQWAEISVGDVHQFGTAQLVSQAPAWQHVAILLAYTAALLLAAVWIVRHRAYAEIVDA